MMRNCDPNYRVLKNVDGAEELASAAAPSTEGVSGPDSWWNLAILAVGTSVKGCRDEAG